MRRTRPPIALVALLVAALLAGCGGGSGSSGEAGGTTASSPATTTASPGVTTVIVADSEIPDEVAALVGQADGISLGAASSADGATMAELDPTVDAVLADDPAVLVYAGGTNDLPSGPTVMLNGLTGRLERWSAERCVVVAVPIFRWQGTTDEAIAQETAGTRVLEQAVVDAGATPVSYLDIALAMRAEGASFWGDGELGDLHPGAAAHPRIAAAIADAVRACPAG